MLIVGLTGSIAMGKTTVANYIGSCGVPVLDSDSTVHLLYQGEAVPHIEEAFPGTTSNGKVDRVKLGCALMRSQDGFTKLESLVHPLVREAQWRFIRKQRNAGAQACVLDIPLLFETGGDTLMDLTVVVSAPENIQTERAMQRPGMTEEKLRAIRGRQLPDAEKRKRADIIIDTGTDWGQTQNQIDKLLESFKNYPAKAYMHWRALYGNTVDRR